MIPTVAFASGLEFGCPALAVISALTGTKSTTSKTEVKQLCRIYLDCELKITVLQWLTYESLIIRLREKKTGDESLRRSDEYRRFEMVDILATA